VDDENMKKSINCRKTCLDANEAIIGEDMTLEFNI
jgi:hypothetical protein